MVLSTEDLTFLARLAKSPDGQRFLAILEAKLGHEEGQLRRLDSTPLYRAQGRAGMLDELIDDIREAQAKLARNQSTESRPLRRVVSTSGRAA